MARRDELYESSSRSSAKKKIEQELKATRQAWISDWLCSERGETRGRTVEKRRSQARDKYVAAFNAANAANAASAAAHPRAPWRRQICSAWSVVAHEQEGSASWPAVKPSSRRAVWEEYWVGLWLKCDGGFEHSRLGRASPPPSATPSP